MRKLKLLPVPRYLTILAMASFLTSANAANLTWTGGGPTNAFTNSVNWGNAALAAGDNFTINNNNTSLDAGSQSLNLRFTTNYTIGTLAYGSGATSARTIFSGGTMTITTGITLDAAAGNQGINASIALGADNTWTVGANKTLALGNPMNLNNRNLTLSGLGSFSMNGFAGIGNITNNANLSINSTNSSTLGNVISGTGALTKSGTGVLTLSGANTYTGLTTVSGGTLAYGVNNALNTGNVTVNGGTLDLSTFSDTVGTVTLTSGNINGTSGVLSSTGTFEMQSGSVSAILGGTSALNKTGAGTVTLSGANTYTGTTTVSAGTLTLSGNRTVNTTGGYTVGGTGTQTLNIQAGNYGIGGDFIVGNTTGGTSTVNHSAGTISIGGANGLMMAQNTGQATAIYNLSGGSLTSAHITMAHGSGASAASPNSSTINVSGGTLAATSTLRIGNYLAGTSGSFNTVNTFNQTGGTTIVNALGLGGNGSRHATSSTGPIIANLNLTGGTFTATNIASISAGGAANASDANKSFINIGGNAQVTLGTFGSIVKGQNATATITFDSGAGGFLAPVAASATYMPTGTFTSAFLTANGANFNVGTGKDITIGQALENASGAAGTLTKSGVGLLTLSGNNTYTGATTISAGTLEIGAGGRLGAGSYAGNISNNGTLIYSGTNAQTLSGIISGNGALTQNNTSTLTLDPGAGQSSSVGNFSVKNGAGLLKSGTLSVTTTTNGLKVGGATGPTFTLDGGNLNTTGGAYVGGNAAGGRGTFTINSGTWTNTGGFISIMYGATGDGSVMHVNGGLVDSPQIQLGQNAGTSTLNLNGGIVAVNDLFNTGSTSVLNLNGGILQAKSSSTNFMAFTGASSTVNVLAGGAIIDTKSFTNTISVPLLSGTANDGGLTKQGAGTLVLGGTNTYNGATTVSAGTLLVNTGASIAASASIVNGGLLRVNGAAGSVTVNSGGSLGGSGTVGAVTLNSGGLLNPGNSPGLLTASEATWKAGSTYQWEINNATGTAGTNWDLFSVVGALDLSALSSTAQMNLVLESLSIANFSTTSSYTWVIAQAGSFIGTGLADGTNVTDLFNINATAFNGGLAADLPNGGFKVEVGTDANNLRTLNLMAIPEPNTRTLLLAGSLVGMMALRRRRA